MSGRIVTCACGYQMSVPFGWTKPNGKCSNCGAAVPVPLPESIDPYSDSALTTFSQLVGWAIFTLVAIGMAGPAESNAFSALIFVAACFICSRLMRGVREICKRLDYIQENLSRE